MKFIHCADIHLDSRMESNLSPEQAKERGAELLATVDRLVRYAAENDVKAVLIAGDMFDTQRASRHTAGYVLERIRQEKNVDFLYLRGNHDEGRSILAGLELPENFKTFGPEWTSYRYDNVVVTALEPEKSDWNAMYDRLCLHPDDTNIVMLHGQASASPGEEQIALPLLKGKHIDYLALGHLHTCQELPFEGGKAWYSGCLEGRGFDECGEKGFILLTIEGKAVRPEFVGFASRELHNVPVDLTGLTTVHQILDAMTRASAGISARDLVKFTLTGSFTPETQKDLRFLEKMLAPRFYFVKIKDESRLCLDCADYAHDISLKGEFIRMVLASDLSRDEKDRMILWGIQALRGEEVTA